MCIRDRDDGWHRTSPILLTVSSVVVYTTVTTFILESYPKANWSYVSYDLDVDQNNEIKVLQTTQSSPDWQNRYAARPIDSEEPFQTADIVPAAAAAIFEGHGIRSSPFRKFTYLGGFDEYPTTVYVEIVESDNRLFVYSNGQLKAIITPDGGFRDKRKVTGRFSGISYGGVFVNHYQKTPVHISHGVFVDANGIYQIDIADLSIRQLAKGKFDYINTQLGPDSSPSTLWAKSNNQLIRFAVRPSDPAVPLPLVNEQRIQ